QSQLFSLDDLLSPHVGNIMIDFSIPADHRALHSFPTRRSSDLHPSAVVSPTATIGYGTVVMPGAYINAKASIGRHCIINTGAIIDRKSTRLNSSHVSISYAVFCLKKKRKG